MKMNSDKTQIVSELQKLIPNLLDYFSISEIIKIMGDAECGNGDELASVFIDKVWDMPMRRCSHCGNLMTEGYMLDSQYACSDECRNALYDPDDSENALRLYLIDCHMIDPDEVEGMSADEIAEKYKDYEISDNVMYTIWE